MANRDEEGQVYEWVIVFLLFAIFGFAAILAFKFK